MSSKTRVQLEEWLKTIDVKADKILDIGGSQYPIKGRTKSWDVKDYKILDLIVPHECKRKPDIIFDIQEDLNEYKKRLFTYDIAFCLEVSEYWYDPYQALWNINKMLKEGGELYISFHFLYKFHPPEGQDFLRYTPYGAEKLLKETGFEIVDHEFRTTDSNHLTLFYEEDKMRGKSNLQNNVTGSLIKAKKV